MGDERRSSEAKGEGGEHLSHTLNCPTGGGGATMKAQIPFSPLNSFIHLFVPSPCPSCPHLSFGLSVSRASLYNCPESGDRRDSLTVVQTISFQSDNINQRDCLNCFQKTLHYSLSLLSPSRAVLNVCACIYNFCKCVFVLSFEGKHS